MNKEKMVQIYEAMADMTLEMLGMIKGKTVYLDDFQFEMVRATESLYNSISYANQPTIVPTSMLDVSGE